MADQVNTGIRQWGITAQVVLMTESHGRRLHISCSNVGPWEWVCLALEADTTLDMQSTFKQLLDEHSHQLLEPSHSLPEAMKKAEKYAKWWRDARASHVG